MSLHGGSPCNARSVAQSLGRIALLSALPGPRHQDSTRPLMKPGDSNWRSLNPRSSCFSQSRLALASTLRHVFQGKHNLARDIHCRKIALSSIKRTMQLEQVNQEHKRGEEQEAHH